MLPPLHILPLFSHSFFLSSFYQYFSIISSRLPPSLSIAISPPFHPLSISFYLRTLSIYPSLSLYIQLYIPPPVTPPLLILDERLHQGDQGDPIGQVSPDVIDHDARGPEILVDPVSEGVSLDLEPVPQVARAQSLLATPL